MSPSKTDLFVVSAPSGAGKTTLIELILRRIPSLLFSVSHTTRPPRFGETDGVEYIFADRDRFLQMVDQNEFLEWAEVHGHYYGTSRQMLQLAEDRGKDLLLDLDVQGAAHVRKIMPQVVSIFILPPSMEVLQERLNRRKMDSTEQIQNRMENARREIQACREFDYVIVNDGLADALESLAAILHSVKYKKEKMTERISSILKSFHIEEP